MASTLHVLCALAKDLWPFDAQLPATCSSMLTLLRVPHTALIPRCVYLTCVAGLSWGSRLQHQVQLQLVLHFVYIFLQSCLCRQHPAATCTRLLRCPLSIVCFPLPFAFDILHIRFILQLQYLICSSFFDLAPMQISIHLVRSKFIPIGIFE